MKADHANYAVLKAISQYCLDNNITKQKVARKLGLYDYPHLFKILTFSKGCTRPLVSRLAKLLGWDEDTVGISFGYYPLDWGRYCRFYPEEAVMVIDMVLTKNGMRTKKRPPNYKAQGEL